MSEENDTDKPYDPTQRKLEEARKKGEVARSTDLSTAAGYGGFLAAALLVGGASVTTLGDLFATLVGQSDRLAELFFDGQATAPMAGVLAPVIWAIAPWFVIPAFCVLVMVVAQRALIFAPDKVQLKASRISLVSNAKNKFGRSGLFEFTKSFVKLVVYSGCLGIFLSSRMNEMSGAVFSTPHIASMMLVELCIDFLLVVLLVAVCIGAVDYLWQRFEHIRKNMMSRKEIQDEHKSSEGDPHMKQERRQRAHEIAMNSMLQDVPTADVIIVNPTHYAVALKWSRKRGEAPECVAKGVDEIALRIRKIAETSDVPIRNDPPTARALFATTEIGEQISIDHFRAVAAAIRFADLMRRRAT